MLKNQVALEGSKALKPGEELLRAQRRLERRERQLQQAAKREALDDIQHLQSVQRQLQATQFSPLQSQLNTIIQRGLANLQSRERQNKPKLDPAKQLGLSGIAGDNGLDDKGYIIDGVEGGELSAGPLDVGGLEGPAANLDMIEGVDAQPTEYSQMANVDVDTQVSIDSQNLSRLANNAAPSWVWMMSQLLQTDLMRLGVEPNELDDIRVFLIKTEANNFPGLKKLRRLPESLAPAELTKVFDDIRTITTGYVMYLLAEKLKALNEEGDEVKHIPQIPRSVAARFFGVKVLEFDPEEELRKLG